MAGGRFGLVGSSCPVPCGLSGRSPGRLCGNAVRCFQDDGRRSVLEGADRRVSRRHRQCDRDRPLERQDPLRRRSRGPARQEHRRGSVLERDRECGALGSPTACPGDRSFAHGDVVPGHRSERGVSQHRQRDLVDGEEHRSRRPGRQYVRGPGARGRPDEHFAAVCGRRGTGRLLDHRRGRKLDAIPRDLRVGHEHRRHFGRHGLSRQPAGVLHAPARRVRVGEHALPQQLHQCARRRRADDAGVHRVRKGRVGPGRVGALGWRRVVRLREPRGSGHHVARGGSHERRARAGRDPLRHSLRHGGHLGGNCLLRQQRAKRPCREHPVRSEAPGDGLRGHGLGGLQVG